ncbi:PDZ domain-containing protein [Yoonia sp. SS1-5]|uniref:PDZ domain-containing protein n=1 Tax=Yoonia rhodophyticola TaxID=3137370 RepID=A0AAN0NKX8_9RHOB
MLSDVPPGQETGVAVLAGMLLETHTDGDDSYLRVLFINPLSEAYRGGLRVGDRIVKAGPDDVSSLADLVAVIALSERVGLSSLTLRADRDGIGKRVSLSIR